jgi:hypothetical protein
METQKTIHNISKFISYIFHPLIIPTIGCIVIFNSGYYLGYLPVAIKHSVYIIVFVLTFLLPALIIPALYFQRIISSINLEERKERVLPILIVVIMYGLSYYFMQRAGFPPLLLTYIIGCIAGIIVSLLITIKWKVSLHTTGLGGLTALIFFLIIKFNLSLQTYFTLVIIISGFTATARMITGSHKPAQVYIGYVAGFCSVLIPLWFFL